MKENVLQTILETRYWLAKEGTKYGSARKICQMLKELDWDRLDDHGGFDFYLSDNARLHLDWDPQHAHYGSIALMVDGVVVAEF